MKRKIHIIFEDIDDIKKTLITLQNLFEIIFEYYSTNKMLKKLSSFVLYCTLYFGKILQELGISEDDLKDEPFD